DRNVTGVQTCALPISIAGTVRDFVRRELVPHEDMVERLDAVPPELAREIRGKALAAGLYAANFPAELGGGGLDAMGVTLAEREQIGRASCREGGWGAG